MSIEDIKISRRQLKQWDFNFVKFIFAELDEEGGTEIGKKFKIKSSRRIKISRKQLVIKLVTKLFESNREPIASLEEKIMPCKQTEYFYLISKERSSEQTEKLYKFLIDNESKQRKFYYGAVVKHLLVKDFLEWKINI